MKKPTGRKPTFPPEVMRIIAEKAASGELTYREAARVYEISHGTVHACKRQYGDGTRISNQHEQTAHLPRAQEAEKTAVVTDMRQLIREISKLDEEIGKLKKYPR